MYLRERGADVRDVARRILGKLLFVNGEMSPRLDEPAVVVSTHLVPSLTVHLDRKNILAFATEKGGATSHAAILARSIGIPAVSGLTDITSDLVDGEMLAVDGLSGMAVARPTRTVLRSYARKARRFESDRHQAMRHGQQPAVTADGTTIQVMANVGRPEDLELARQHGADGVGLYRTEFEFLSHTSPPDENRLADVYGAAAEKFGDREMVIRVLDIGGDKFPPSLPLPHEDNPFLGWRGLRLLLDHEQEILLPQLRAILRASARGRVAVLYPMVTGVDELVAVQHALAKAKAQLSRKHVDYDRQIRQGIMVEVPSAVVMLDALLAWCDFASVGTNDLVQYVLAVDRNNERLADSYNPLHPAVVKCLNAISLAAQAADKPVAVCGEIAGDPLYTGLLLGLGYTHLSANVGAIPYIKQAVRRCHLRHCRALADEALACTTTHEAVAVVEREHRGRRGRSTPTDGSRGKASGATPGAGDGGH